MKKKFLIKTLLLLTAFVFLKINCIAYAQNNKKVVLQLRWNHQYQFAGYYVAKWMGFYDAEGLDVEIKSAFTSNNSILVATKEVLEGRADFGIGSDDVLMEENKGANLCIVASLFQRSAVEYYMKSDTPYRGIVDLTKLNIARRKNDLLDIELQAMLENEGIKSDNTEMLPYSTEFSAADLATGKYDVIPGYLGTITYLAQQSKLSLRIIKPIDYGIDFYGDSLFTKRDLALTNPDLVEKFKKASIKGWEYALEHPVETAKRISTEFKIEGQSVKELEAYNLFQEKKVAELTLYPVVEIGNINPNRWMKMQETLLKLGIVNGTPDFNSFIFNYDKIINDRNKRLEMIFIVLMIGSFCIFLIYFIVRLTTNNVILKKENNERKKAEEKIIRSTQRYETMFSSALLGITITTIKGIILQANKRWLDMTGYNEEDVIGRSIFELIIPEDDNVLKLKDRFLKEEIESYEIEQQYIRKDGRLICGKLFMTSIFDQDSDNKVNMGMVLDITNTKTEEETVRRSESRFRRIINEIASGMPEVEPNDSISEYKTSEGVYSLSTEKSQLSLKLEKINLELERMFKNEMDENKKKEALLIYQARFAAMGEMIGNIAHQWRQPLNNLGLIISNLEDASIYDELEPEVVNNVVGKCRKLISRMSDTIDDFRYFLKPQNGKTNFSICENINVVLELLDENLKFNKVNVTMDTKNDVVAFGYANQYSQAIFNIISNSIDALAEQFHSNKEIGIKVYKEADMISVEISDNGGGIKEENIDKIFDVYFSTKGDKNGTGLGLYMTKLIIENNMSGRVELLEHGTGVTIKVTIPENGGSKIEGARK
ncbi:ABC transporter substrate-binding protein [Clostridium estertheticum]|uniref:ABC transporter substrate-binding protein n=1 Tax=Clostridium estertheticum TaxID=238834 RepID=UPI0013E9341F|nr:ABC transporter substrate-binding protein [Clostridium estertheticum]MBZ9686367.1 ABC transporter substrate-binding protein [Clostridium estertheticum]